MEEMNGYAGEPCEEVEKCLHVLVVDNEEDIRGLLADLLTSAGHRVTAACDGNEALEIFSREAIDLVITDLGLPVMSGWEVARSIKKLAPGVMVAMITGWGADFDDVQMLESGIHTIVNKPFRTDQILNLAREVMAAKKTMQAERSLTQ